MWCPTSPVRGDAAGSEDIATSASDLVRDVEHSNPSIYRRDVLVRAHRDRLIEYDAGGRQAYITPVGIEYVERTLGKYLVA